MNKIEQVIKRIEPLDPAAMAAASERQDNLTKPRGSLGVLESLSIQIAGIQRKNSPVIEKKAIITMAADHGVVNAGVSLYPQEVTRQMVINFLHGGAAINVLARTIGARVAIVDMGVIGGFEPTDGLICEMIDFGTKDSSKGPAMTQTQAIQSIEVGIRVLEGELKKGLDIVATGEMGIGNTTSAAAIIASITGKAVEEITGRGTGIDDTQLKHKIKVIKDMLKINNPNPANALDVLAKVGGFEIGGMVGVTLAAAANKVPVVVDGVISGSAALIAVGICPQVKDYIIASHLSVEQGHAICLDHMNLKPLFNLNMRLGEGTGAALGIFLAQAAVNTLNQMVTFAEAGVSDTE